MANPIQKNDLISDEALRALEEMSRLLREDKENMDALMASFKQYAGSIQTATTANSGNNDALAAALQKVSELEKAYSDLQKAMKENAATQKAINAEKRMYSKLTQEEATEVKNLRTELKWLNDEDKNVVEYVKKKIAAINTEKMSYNQLQQTYNALMDSIKRMTTEEVRNSEAGKLMVNTAKQIRETMNETQQSVGNFTLQVGKYRAAFDGLGYSFQQILREIPSALNPQQFFLAISNNIPLFMDQVKAFKAEQEEIKKRMQELEEAGQTATEEYKNLGNKVTSFGTKMKKSIFSWQTAIIAAIFVLRQYGGDIINWFTGLFKKATEAVDELTIGITNLNIAVMETVGNEKKELELIVSKLDKIKRGTDEWKKAVDRVNEITKSTLNYQTAMPDEIRKVTKAYIEQAMAIAKNQEIVEKLSKDTMGRNLFNNVMGGGYGILFNENVSPEEVLRKLGLDPTNNEDLVELIEKNRGMSSRTSMGFWNRLGQTMSGSVFMKPINVIQDLFWDTDMEKEFEKSMSEESAKIFVDLINTMRDRMGILNNDVATYYEEQYQLLGSINTDNGGSGRTYSLKDIDFFEKELLDKDAVIELESEFKRRLAMLEEMEAKERFLLTKRYEQEQKDLEFNHEKKLITDQEYEEQRLKLEKNYIAIIRTNEEGNFEEMGVIQRKYWNKRNELTAKEAEREEKEALAREKKAIKDLEDAYASQYRVVQRRIKTIQQEKQQNQDLAFNISLAKEELAKLNEMVITAGEDATGYTDRINKLTQQIEKWRKQMQFDKQLSNYGSVWDIFQRNGAFEAGNDTMRGIARNLFGDLADDLDDSQIEQIYDTWLQNTQKAATEWYNTTMGYINDLISAYVELANAKAEAAKEATDAAQEEYEKEKALLEAGYASRVEATWAEYQEKKAAQEKAEEDAKAAAKAQQEINNLSTMGSLITAAANIWKTFTEIPVVGIPLAIAATGTMFGAFLAAKIKANEVSKYGEGGFEVLEGGSHASGHDIDLGVRNRRGRRMRAEGKEGIGIFRIGAMNHYGADNIEGWVNSINRLEFEDNAAKRMSLERSVGMAVLSAPRTDLHRVESDLHKLVSYGSRSRTVNADGSVTEIRKNAKIVYKNG